MESAVLDDILRVGFSSQIDWSTHDENVHNKGMLINPPAATSAGCSCAALAADFLPPEGKHSKLTADDRPSPHY